MGVGVGVGVDRAPSLGFPSVKAEWNKFTLSTNLCGCLFSFKFYSYYSITTVLLITCTRNNLYLQKLLFLVIILFFFLAAVNKG